MTRYIATDTETSGFGPKIHKILELALIPFDPLTGKIYSDKFYSRFNPEKKVSEEAQAVHGMSWEMLKEEPLFEEKALEIQAFLKGNILVAQNAKFDVAFLNREFERLKLPLVETICKAVIDTYSLACLYLPQNCDKNLDGLCDFFKVDRSSRHTHGAEIDAILLAEVYPLLRAIVEEKNKQVKLVSGVDLDCELGLDIDVLADDYFKLQHLIKILESKEKKISEKIRDMTGGVDVSRDSFEVVYTPTVKTDWDQISKDYLEGVDLSKYKTTGSKMTIKVKK